MIWPRKRTVRPSSVFGKDCGLWTNWSYPAGSARYLRYLLIWELENADGILSVVLEQSFSARLKRWKSSAVKAHCWCESSQLGLDSIHRVFSIRIRTPLRGVWKSFDGHHHAQIPSAHQTTQVGRCVPMGCSTIV